MPTQKSEMENMSEMSEEDHKKFISFIKTIFISAISISIFTITYIFV